MSNFIVSMIGITQFEAASVIAVPIHQTLKHARPKNATLF